MNTSLSNSEKLTSLSGVRAILERIEVHPRKALGQNFLIDANIRDILITAADLQSGDVVVEAGPGLGVLTEELVKKAGKVIAVELDERLAQYLAERFAGVTNLQIVRQDMVTFDMAAAGASKFVSNLPYSAGSRILVELVRSPVRPADMLIMVQQEVAHRLMAEVGTSEFGLLGLWVGLDYSVEQVKVINPTCFWPQPSIKSVALKLKRREQVLLNDEERAQFYALTKWVFGYRRKKLITVMRGKKTEAGGEKAQAIGELLSASGIPEDARAEQVPLENWIELVRGSRQ